MESKGDYGRIRIQMIKIQRKYLETFPLSFFLTL